MATLLFIIATRLGITTEIVQPTGRPASGIGWKPTNRTPINRGSNVQITEEVVRLFVFCSEAEEEGTADTPEYFKALRAYHHLIRFRPWEFDPLQIVTEEPPAAVLRDRPDRLAEWRKARALRTKIENVAVELGI